MPGTSAGLPSAEPDGFEAESGQGISATVDGHRVVIGRPAHLERHDVELGDLTSRGEALAAAGKTPVYVAIDGRAAGAIAIADTLKAGSRAAVAELHRLGLDVIMLTGDNETTAQCHRPRGGRRPRAGRRAARREGRPGAPAAGRRQAGGDGRRRRQRRAGPGPGRRRHRHRHRHRCRDRVGRRDADERRPAGGGHRHRPVAGHDAQHQAEPVLGLRLQRGAHPAGRRRLLSVHRHPAGPDLRGRRDGRLERHGGVQRAAPADLPPATIVVDAAQRRTCGQRPQPT